jgi:hypothetical protein
MRYKVTRRKFIGAIGVSVAIPITVNAQYELTPEVVPASLASTPVATPTVPLSEYRGNLQALWDEPWEIEGKLVRFKRIVIQSLQVDEGKAIRVGLAGDYRTLLRVEIPTINTLWVASDIDPDSIKDRRTIEVEGLYGGEFGPGWTEPVVRATKWAPVS